MTSFAMRFVVYILMVDCPGPLRVKPRDQARAKEANSSLVNWLNIRLLYHDDRLPHTTHFRLSFRVITDTMVGWPDRLWKRSMAP